MRPRLAVTCFVLTINGALIFGCGFLGGGPTPVVATKTVGADGADRYIALDAEGTVLFNLPGEAVGSYSEGLIGVKDLSTGKWGFVGEDGSWEIVPKYDSVGPFSEGLAGVEVSDKWGFIDLEGTMVIEPQFFSLGCVIYHHCGFSEGFAAVRTNDPKRRSERRWGYIGSTGELVISAEYSGAGRFGDGLAPVGFVGKVGDNKGYIDSRGTTVIEPKFELAGQFSEGLAGVLMGDSLDGMVYIDTTGTVAVSPPSVDMLGPFIDDVAWACTGRPLCGLIDKTGTWIVEPHWMGAIPMAGGLYLVGTDLEADRFGFADRTGALVWTNEQMNQGATAAAPSSPVPSAASAVQVDQGGDVPSVIVPSPSHPAAEPEASPPPVKRGASGSESTRPRATRPNGSRGKVGKGKKRAR